MHKINYLSQKAPPTICSFSNNSDSTPLAASLPQSAHPFSPLVENNLFKKGLRCLFPTG